MPETQVRIKIRKAPKFLPFLISGAVVGFLAALVIRFSLSENTTDGGLLGYLIGWLTLAGAALGIMFALVADWLYSRSVKEVQATKLEG